MNSEGRSTERARERKKERYYVCERKGKKKKQDSKYTGKRYELLRPAVLFLHLWDNENIFQNVG